jgi:hypothetical protein
VTPPLTATDAEIRGRRARIALGDRALAGPDPDSDDDELRRSQGREPDQDVDEPLVDVGLRHGLRAAPDEVRLVPSLSPERPEAEQLVQERADDRAEARPEQLPIGLEHGPLGPPSDALFEEEGEAAHRHVLPVGLMVGRHRAGAPDHRYAVDDAQGVDAEWGEVLDLPVVEVPMQPGDAPEIRLGGGGRLPHPHLRG